ncbi:hypothetical protein [Xanthomonas campestris]|uniref:EF-Tu C-terminal domain-related protein n=1 Tax=Xanthomonas campestris TaxID=339 RepID=UPI003083C619
MAAPSAPAWLPRSSSKCLQSGDFGRRKVEGNPVAMDEGLRFAIREGGRTVGAGVVAKIVK